MRNAIQPLAIVVDTSPYARLRPLPLTAVTLTDAFWAPRLRINREVTLPSQYRQLEETGRVDNFRRAAGKIKAPFQGRYYNDSDVYKWLEAAAWTLATADDPGLAQMADTVIGAIIGAQGADGYLNSYFTFDRAAERWTNLQDKHELYCAGHLIQAAVAHHRTTGENRLLHVARRLADHICQVFGAREGTPGHPEIEMALVELARTTGEARYLRQASSFLDQRGRGLIGGRAYHQDHQPFREMERMAGHAVRALYLSAGAADLYAETGEPALRETLERLWRRMTTRQMYVSGGVGSRAQSEAFGEDYELPNARAYSETCAAIANVMWNWRMLALEGDARYADPLETALFNAVLVGVSLDGRSYFYRNPLADDGTHRRQPWFGCACCPPNLARLLASLPGYFYGLSDEGIWVHLYAGGKARIVLPDGRAIGLIQQTRYPWEGEVSIEVNGEGAFGLMLRIPGWCNTPRLEINGRPFDGPVVPSSYAQIRREWRPGDIVRLDLPMPIRPIEPHPYLRENAGRVALMRGPLLYCVEGADNPGVDLRDVVLPAEIVGERHVAADLGNAVVLRLPAQVRPPDKQWGGRLYRPATPHLARPAGRPVELTAIPYYAWANRAPGPMRIWLRKT